MHVRASCAFVGVWRSTPSALWRSGCLPRCSTPRRLLGLGDLSCLVSQHCCTPTWTMSCVTFGQTNVMPRGAGPASTGNSTMRTYMHIPWLYPHRRQHTHRHTRAFLIGEGVSLLFTFSSLLSIYQKASQSSRLDIQESRDVQSSIQHAAPLGDLGHE